jgi:hypothetical protein
VVKYTKIRVQFFVSLFALCCLYAGCADPLPPTFTVDVKTTPQTIRPNIPFGLKMEFKHDSQEPVTLNEVRVKLTSASSKKVLNFVAKSEGDLKFSGGNLVVPAAGDWKGELELTVDGFVTTAKVDFTVKSSCSGDKTEGSACCANTDCNSGLTCVYGSCSAKLREKGKACIAATDCASGFCDSGVCGGTRCDDKQKNGNETDTDCGGSCGPCNTGSVCKEDKDCAKGNTCTSGSCTEIPGALLGTGDGSPDSVKLTTITSRNLYTPTDLAFSTSKENELWIVDRSANSMIVVQDVGKNKQSQTVLFDRSRHFLEEVVAISFSPDHNTFGTCGDSRNTYDNLRAPNNFMGPVLWESDLQVNIQYGGADVSKAHLDMLHSSPQCMGMAGVTTNQYFVFNGYHQTLDWYDFRKPHSDKKYGGSNHTDGIARRFSEVKLKRISRLPSNMVYDVKTRWLYIADTGNGRVLRVNVDNVKIARRLRAFPGDGTLEEFSGVKQEVIVPAGGEVSVPTGLALHKGIVYVADNKTSKIHAFQDGKLIRSLDTGLETGSLGGLTVGPDDKIYFIDLKNPRVLRIDP